MYRNTLVVVLTFFICVCNAVNQLGITTFPSLSSSGGAITRSLAAFQYGVIVGGTFNGIVNIQKTDFSSQNTDIFLTRFNSSSVDSVIWTKTLGGDGADFLNSLVIDSNSNIVFGGYLNGNGYYGGANVTSLGQDALLVKLDSTGTYVWDKLVGNGQANEQVIQMALDSNDNIYVAGVAYSGASANTNWGGSDVPIAGDNDWVIAKYDTNGGHLWSLAIGGTGSDNTKGIAVDSQGNVAVIGLLNSPSVTLNGTTYTSYTVLIVKYDTNGNFLSDNAITTLTDVDGNGVAFDASGNLFATGTFGSTLDWGLGSSMTTAGMWDVYLVKFNSSGSPLWQTKFGGDARDFGLSVAVASDGFIYVAGQYQNSPFVNGTSESYSLTDSQSIGTFTARFTSSGKIDWAAGYPSAGLDTSAAYNVPILNPPSPYLNGAYLATVYPGATMKDLNGQSIPAYSGTNENSFLACVGALPSPSPSVTPTVTPTASPSPSAGYTPSPSSSPFVYASASPPLPSRQDITVNASLALNQTVTAIASDYQDNIFVAGAVQAAMPVRSLQSPCYLSKYDSSFNLLWTNEFGTKCQIASVGVDSKDNVVITGSTFYDTIDFGGGNHTSTGQEIFVVKFDNDGNFLWNQYYGNSSQWRVYVAQMLKSLFFSASAVSFGKNDSVFVGGFVFSGLWTVFKFSSDGELQFLSDFSVSYSSPAALLVNSSTDISLLLGSVTVLKVLANGTLAETTTNYNYSYSGAAADSTGSHYLCGMSVQDPNNNFKRNPSTASFGGVDIYLAKYDSDQFVWDEIFGGSGFEMAESVVVNTQDYVIITGAYSSNISIGGAVLPWPDDSLNCYVAMYNSTGGYQWHAASQGPFCLQSFAAGLKASTGFVIAQFFNTNITTSGITASAVSGYLLIKYNVPADIDQQSSSSSTKDNSTLLIAIIVPIGTVAVIGAALGVAVFMMKKKRDSNDDIHSL